MSQHEEQLQAAADLCERLEMASAGMDRIADALERIATAAEVASMAGPGFAVEVSLMKGLSEDEAAVALSELIRLAQETFREARNDA